MPEAREGGLHIPSMKARLYAMRHQLPMFTITDHPADWPDFYVARLHLCLPEPTATDFIMMHPDLEYLQETMEALGLVKLMRDPADDPMIVETWI